jgi:hypothetical protein
MQKNFYNNTDAIVIDKNNKSNIVLIDGDKKKIENQSNQFYNYVEKFSNVGVSPFTKKQIKSFVKLVSDDIAIRNLKFNSTKKTTTKKPIVKVKIIQKPMKKAIEKKATSKKAAPKKAASKKPSMVYAKNKQHGTSNKIFDKQRKALAPGKRKSKDGNVYYEYRKNESDKPGTMMGIFGNNMYSHRNNIEKILNEKINLTEKHKKSLKIAVGSDNKIYHRKLIIILKKQILSLRKQLADQNKLINSNLR